MTRTASAGPKDHAARARRRVLTAAARKLFLARGYAGTTVAAVAERAGVSPDTIYVSLRGKQGLLEGAWSLALSDLQDRAQLDQDQREDVGRARRPAPATTATRPAQLPDPGQDQPGSGSDQRRRSLDWDLLG